MLQLVQEVSKVHLPQLCLLIRWTLQYQVTTPFANGAKINGMINCGFNTIGVPKIKGSLMLHTAGINAVLPRDLPYADF